MFYPGLSHNWTDLEVVFVALADPKPQQSYDFSSPTLNVGWLDPSHKYSKGTVSSEFISALRTLCKNPTCCKKGFHTCGFCGANPRVESNGKPMMLGSAEIEVVGEDAIYRAPALVLHYVEEHQYLPPQEFIEAVLAIARKET